MTTTTQPNRFELAARLWKALKRLDEREKTALERVAVDYQARRAELLAAAPPEVRAMVSEGESDA